MWLSCGFIGDLNAFRVLPTWISQSFFTRSENRKRQNTPDKSLIDKRPWALVYLTFLLTRNVIYVAHRRKTSIFQTFSPLSWASMGGFLQFLCLSMGIRVWRIQIFHKKCAPMSRFAARDRYWRFFHVFSVIDAPVSGKWKRVDEKSRKQDDGVKQCLKTVLRVFHPPTSLLVILFGHFPWGLFWTLKAPVGRSTSHIGMKFELYADLGLQITKMI